MLPGYDFISDPLIANDGDGRDADATDPGDWVTQSDTSNPSLQGQDCDGRGQLVARHRRDRHHRGEFEQRAMDCRESTGRRRFCRCACSANAAVTIRTSSMASHGRPGSRCRARPPTRIPRRSSTSVSAAPGACEAGYHAVFSAALAHGVTRAIVVAAGNEGVDVSNSAPANCSETIAVAATANSGFACELQQLRPRHRVVRARGDPRPDLDADGIAILCNHGTTVPGDRRLGQRRGRHQQFGADGFRRRLAGARASHRT